MSIVRSRKKSAFTLIELLLVLVILAVLASIVVVSFRGRPEQTRNTAAKTDISNIETAIELFHTDTGRYPSTDEGINALVTQPGNVSGWTGPYLKRGLPLDPWGNAYIYRNPGTNNAGSFDLLSTGPDGHEGGGDDIDNWSQNVKK